MVELRSPGKDERFFIIRNALNYYHSVGLTAYLRLKKPQISEESFLETIYNAISSVVKQHPILLVTPINELQDTVSFARLQGLKTSDVLLCQTHASSYDHADRDRELDAELQRQHNVGFVAGGPQWRVVLLRDPRADSVAMRFTVSFIYHHALGDGLSGLAFLRCFIRALNTPEHRATSDIILESSASLLPTMEMLKASMDHKTDAMGPEPEIVEAVPIAARDSEDLRKVWLGAIPVNRFPSSSRLSSFYIASEWTWKLRRLCSTHQSSLTPLLQTIVARSIFLAIPNDFNQLRGLCSVSLRPCFKNLIPEDAMGLYITGFAKKHNRESFIEEDGPQQDSSFDTLWQEVQSTKDSLLAAISQEKQKIKRHKESITEDEKKHTEIVAWMQGMIGASRVASFDINNLGVFKVDNDISEKIEIARIVFSASQSVIGSALKVNIVTGPDGSMTISLTWQEGIIEDATITKIEDSIKAIIESFASTAES